MTRTLLFVLLALVYNGYAQAPSVILKKNFGGSVVEYASSVIETQDQGFVIAGLTYSNDQQVSGNHLTVNQTPSDDFWVVKCSATGVLEWQKCIGGSRDESFPQMRPTADGGCILIGTTESNDGDVTNSHGAHDMFVVKLSADGTLQWSKCYGGSNDDRGYSIQQTADGGYIAAGSTLSNNGDLINFPGQTNDFWILKLTSNGDISWQKRLGGSSSDESPNCVRQTADGGYIVAGYSASANGDIPVNNGVTDVCIFKLTESGEVTWQKSYGGMGHEQALDIIQTADGQYAATGFTRSYDVPGFLGGADLWILRLDTAGSLLWQKPYGGTLTELGHSMVQLPDGNLAVAGITNSQNGDVSGLYGSLNDGWIMCVSPENGNLLWQNALGGAHHDGLFSLICTADGGLAACGGAYSSYIDVPGNFGLEDFWLLKLSGGALAKTTFSNNAIRVYPNPTYHTIQVVLEDQSVPASLRIYDMMGKQLMHAQNTTQLNLEVLASGSYVLEIESGLGEKFTQTILRN